MAKTKPKREGSAGRPVLDEGDRRKPRNFPCMSDEEYREYMQDADAQQMSRSAFLRFLHAFWKKSKALQQN